MADVKISQLPAATTPLDGTELAPIVQSGTTKRVSVANLTVGRALTASSLTLTTPLSAANGGTGLTSLGTGIATFLGTPTSANLAAAVTDETGTGALVFGTSPTFTTSALFPAGAVSAPGISVSGDTNTGIYFPAADTIGFVEGGVESMRINSSGYVGIATTNPATLLDMFSGTLGAAGKARIGDFRTSSGNGFTIPAFEALGNRDDGNTTFEGRIGLAVRRSDGTALQSTALLGMVAFGGQVGTSTSYSAADLLYPASIKGVAEGAFTSSTAMPTAITFSTGSSGDDLTTANRTYGTERMRITSAGNVGIGTTSPTSATNFGSLCVNGSSGSFINLFANDAWVGGMETDNGAVYVESIANIPLILRTNGTERARISSDGTFRVKGAGTAGSTDAVQFSGSAPASSLLLDASGNLGIGTASPSTYNGLLNVKASDRSVIGYFGGTTYAVRFGANSSFATVEGVDAATGVSSYQPISINGSIVSLQSGGTECARIDASGNLLVGTTSSPTTGTQCLTIETGTAATASPADTITIYSTDLSAGNTMLSLYTEGTPVNANATAAATHRIAIRVNGTVYYLLANTSA